MMKNILKRVFKRIVKSMAEVYGPPVICFAFAMIFISIFPDGPYWPIPVFIILVIIYFPRFVKW